ncbi:hypothetical protein A8C32_12420 [Flavivirga aquatica]|uniref:Uncharacterized protein n=1 Tax=Flavivirga aquatica TaxID=1849968 RepID=A0A1E5TDT6_9FLAO|nr:tetratricopeptide repeat-containing sensor histidine kinase [Flavivirga aquatica]OEK09507.1 hypothetical protein A8C32_12420 [Flavivirga aquatica]
MHSQKAIDSSLYYYNFILKPRNHNDLTNAYVFFEKHKNQSLIKKDTLKIILNLRYIAVIQNKLGALYDSENSIVTAMSYLDNIKGVDTLIEPRIGIYNQLGMIYRQFEDYDKSLEYYNKVLEITKDPNNIAQINNNKANVFKYQRNYTQAINEFQKAFSFYTKQGNIIKAARALDNIGIVQSKTQNPDALTNLERALSMRKNANHTSGIFTSYLHISEYYKDEKNNEKALFYAKKALKIANFTKNIKHKENALSMLLNLKNDKNIIEYKTIEDSLKKAKQIQENKYAAIKYNVKEKEKIINERELMLKSTELEKEKETKLKLVYLFIGLSILLMSFFLILILKSKHKKDKIQQVYNTETRISKKVHDEVSNDMYHLLTKLQSNPNIQENILDDISDIYIRTRDISKENSIIEVKEDYGDLLKDLLISFKNDKVNILTKNISKIDWDAVEDIKKTTLYRVLQELMINMKKHSRASLVVLNFNQERHKITINYNDNGIGAAIKKGTGIHNVENRMQSINGTIIFETEINKGFKAKITV